MSAQEVAAREVDDALADFTAAQLEMLAAGRRLLRARARWTEAKQPGLATVTEIHRSIP